MKPKRAKKGSIALSINVRLQKDLHAYVEAAAERDGLSLAEWIRRACHAQVLRQEWERLEKKREGP